MCNIVNSIDETETKFLNDVWFILEYIFSTTNLEYGDLNMYSLLFFFFFKMKISRAIFGPQSLTLNPGFTYGDHRYKIVTYGMVILIC